jgi:hypothetical protein
MNTLEVAILDGWGWMLSGPIEVLETNNFGNAIFETGDGLIYRIIPEDLTCTEIAQTRNDLQSLQQSPKFIADWEMRRLVAEAEQIHGKLESGECYHLVIPSVLGGAYSCENIRRISMTEWLSASGDIARQIKDLPDGAEVRLKTTK